MRLEFKCKTNKDYYAINTVKFILPSGTILTVDRENDTYTIDNGYLYTEWRGCYLWSINGYTMSYDPLFFIKETSEFEQLVQDAKVEFELEDDFESDYCVEVISYSVS